MKKTCATNTSKKVRIRWKQTKTAHSTNGNHLPLYGNVACCYSIYSIGYLLRLLQQATLEVITQV